TAPTAQAGPAIAAQIIESLGLFEALGDRQGVAWCLVELARVHAEAGAPERGAQLLGAADALLAALGARPDPVNQAAYERTAAALTAREVEVLRLTAAGLTDAEVAEQLTISRRTVQAHLRSIFSKLGTTNRTAATRFALEHHLA